MSFFARVQEGDESEVLVIGLFGAGVVGSDELTLIGFFFKEVDRG